MIGADFYGKDAMQSVHYAQRSFWKLKNRRRSKDERISRHRFVQFEDRVFTEVAKLGFKANAETLVADMEAIPYEIVG